MKKPHGNQCCEICKAITPFRIVDGRVKQGPHGPKGHWVYMCEDCHREWGISKKDEDYILFERFSGKYFEVRKEESSGSEINRVM